MILSLALLLPMLAMGADDAEILNALRLHKASGEEVTILLKERPVVTFVSNDLVVTTQSNEVSYPSADIMKFTYEAVEYSGVNGLAQSGSLISFLGDELQVAHLAAATEGGGLYPGRKVCGHGYDRRQGCCLDLALGSASSGLCSENLVSNLQNP